jgi:hypothetical protein
MKNAAREKLIVGDTKCDGSEGRCRGMHPLCALSTSNDTELEKLKKRLQFVMYCIDCFVS